jgi:hypothetical protein
VQRVTWKLAYLILLHWTQNICEPELRHSKRGKEGGKQNVGQDALCVIAPPFALLRLARYQRVCLYRATKLADILRQVQPTALCPIRRQSDTLIYTATTSETDLLKTPVRKYRPTLV